MLFQERVKFVSSAAFNTLSNARLPNSCSTSRDRNCSRADLTRTIFGREGHRGADGARTRHMALNLTRLRCVTTPSVMLTEKLYMSDRTRLLSDLLALMSKSHDVATSALVCPAIHEGAPQRDFEIDRCEKNSGATEPPSVIPTVSVPLPLYPRLCCKTP